MTFGILWAAIGMSLVSNIAFATGILLAERTLFLATMGVVIAASDLIWEAGHRVYVRSSAGRIIIGTGLTVLLAMGVSRSASRQQVWHSVVLLWFQSIIDAPLSYRTHHAYGSVLWNVKMYHSAEIEYRRALQLYPRAIPVRIDLGDKYRQAEHCDPAVKEYQEVLRRAPDYVSVRMSEVACLLYLGRYREAAAEARLGASFDVQASRLASYAGIADSAERVHAPLHSINLSPVPDSTPKRP